MTDELNAEVDGWRFPDWPVVILMVAAVAGFLGLLWSQQDSFFHKGTNAVLIEAPLESDSSPNPLEMYANVRWHLVMDSIFGPKIIAEVAIPERRQLIQFSIRKNVDDELPASHIVEILVEEPIFPGRKIAAVPLVFLKPSPEAQGQPLIGAAVQVSTDRFWIALSADRFDMNNNLSLLRERNVFALPMLYETGRQAILGFEKGEEGRRVFEQALSMWSQ